MASTPDRVTGILLSLLAVSVAPRMACAQVTSTASIAVAANVTGRSASSLAAVGLRDLVFGVVTAGSSKTPSSLSSDAGRFLITGTPAVPVTITLSLPSVLTGPASGTIPVSFGSTDGLEWSFFPLTYTTFDPHAAHASVLDAGGNLIIGISGTVSPPALTTTGVYSGTITLTVSY